MLSFVPVTCFLFKGKFLAGYQVLRWGLEGVRWRNSLECGRRMSGTEKKKDKEILFFLAGGFSA